MRAIKRERVMLADEVEALMDVEFFDGDGCDTEITIEGSFCVEGARRKEFGKRLQALVSEFII